MSAHRPETIGEWETYASALAGQELRSQTAGVNSQRFISQMAEEGHDTAHCHAVLMVFIRQCRATGTGLPKGGMWDTARLASGDDLASQGPQMSEDEADALAAAWKPALDDIDEFILKADYDAD